MKVEDRRFNDRVPRILIFHSIEDDTELGHVLCIHRGMRADEADSSVAFEEQGIGGRRGQRPAVYGCYDLERVHHSQHRTGMTTICAPVVVAIESEQGLSRLVCIR